MNKSDLQRLIKLEGKIRKIVDDMGFTYLPTEFDVVPYEKMLEILAYRSSVSYSNWKFGRDYEIHKTIFQNVDPSLPYECVIHGNPSRAYLMNSNTFAVQVLVMAHVFGHTTFFKENRWFHNSREDMLNVLAGANERFIEYEKMYGIDEVEKVIDAGHAIQFHSSPFDTETEEEKRQRLFKQMQETKKPFRSEFGDILEGRTEDINVDRYNSDLWRMLKKYNPVEPTEDLLRFIIDNSTSLEDWQKDILEVLRVEGQYFWPIMKTKFADEGFAVYLHERVVNKLFEDGDLTAEEHGQYNYSNSLVKASQRTSMNPYLIGSNIWESIEKRWDKGQHGKDWDECENYKIKEAWDTKAMEGKAKVKSVLETHTDWMFFQDFLTHKLIQDLDLYIYLEQNYPDGSVEYIRSDHTLEQIRQIIINSFSGGGQPNIEVVDGNFKDNGYLLLNHKHTGSPLDKQYCEETMKHIHYLWNRDILLKTQVNNQELIVHMRK